MGTAAAPRWALGTGRGALGAGRNGGPAADASAPRPLGPSATARTRRWRPVVPAARRLSAPVVGVHLGPKLFWRPSRLTHHPTHLCWVVGELQEIHVHLGDRSPRQLDIADPV